MLNLKIADHLKEANKTYIEHLVGALKTGGECFLAGAAAIIHGFIPFVFEKTNSEIIRKIYHRQNPPK